MSIGDIAPGMGSQQPSSRHNGDHLAAFMDYREEYARYFNAVRLSAMGADPMAIARACGIPPHVAQELIEQQAALEALYPPSDPSAPGSQDGPLSGASFNDPVPVHSAGYESDARIDFSGYGYAHAPMLGARHVGVSGMAPPGSVHCVAPTEPGPGKDAVNMAFAKWYADFVMDLLVNPGNFRKGTGGSCPQVWGAGGREKEAWLRIGWNIGELTAPWARLGVTAREALTPVRGPLNPRYPWMEKRDPYNVLYGRQNKSASRTLVDFVLNMVNRMSLSPTSILYAAYFLNGLGLHEGDGDKGASLRKLLSSWYWFEDDRHAIEKRVAMLGVLLAGKWLDDNSFATRSYWEVTDIPMLHIDQLERAVLSDLHHSLFVRSDSWLSFIRGIWKSHIAEGDNLDDNGLVVLALIDEMQKEAWASQASMPPARPVSLEVSPFLSQYISPNSSPETKHALLDAWTVFDVPPVCPYRLKQPVAHQVAVPEEEEDDEEEEWLEYDGATRWLPSQAEMRRSLSNLSSQNRASSGSGDIPSHDSMTSLPRTPSANPAPRDQPPAIAPHVPQPVDRPPAAHQAQPRDSSATDPIAELFKRLQWQLPSLNEVVPPVAHHGAPSAGPSQSMHTQLPATRPYNAPQRFEPAPAQPSYGASYQYGQPPTHQRLPPYDTYHQAAGATERPAYPALPIHALIGNNVPHVGYSQSRGFSAAATAGRH